MSVNSSSSSNDSILGTQLSLDLPLDIACLMLEPSSHIFSIYVITNVFVLQPICIFIFFHGFQQRRQKRSTSSAVHETVSNFDWFAYHMVAMEMIVVFGGILCCCGIYSYKSNLLLAGVLLSCLTWYGEILFNVLLCVERYLAVVHPVTYLSLRSQRGMRIRNVSTGCVWVLCFAGMGLMMIEDVFTVVNFCTLVIALAVASFCSLSVLCVLIRPGPGEQGGGRRRVDQSKRGAFNTILAILGALLLRFACGLTRAALYVFGVKWECVTITTGFWSNLPSSLVLPLLFLSRAGKCVCCKKENIQ